MRLLPSDVGAPFSARFRVDDVIEFGNDDLPWWAGGRWRVLTVDDAVGVDLAPITVDGTADADRSPVAIRIYEGRVGLVRC